MLIQKESQSVQWFIVWYVVLCIASHSQRWHSHSDFQTTSGSGMASIDASVLLNVYVYISNTSGISVFLFSNILTNREYVYNSVRHYPILTHASAPWHVIFKNDMLQWGSDRSVSLQKCGLLETTWLSRLYVGDVIAKRYTYVLCFALCDLHLV